MDRLARGVKDRDLLFESFWGNADHGKNTKVGEILVLEDDGVAVGFLVGRIVSMEEAMRDKLLIWPSRTLIKADEDAREESGVLVITMESNGGGAYTSGGVGVVEII